MTETKTSEIVVTQINRRIDNLDKRLASKIDRVEERLDSISERGVEMISTLKRNTDSLEEHMKRTEANERQIEEFKKFQYKILGALGLCAAATPFVIFLLNYLTKK